MNITKKDYALKYYLSHINATREERAGTYILVDEHDEEIIWHSNVTPLDESQFESYWLDYSTEEKPKWLGRYLSSHYKKNGGENLDVVIALEQLKKYGKYQDRLDLSESMPESDNLVQVSGLSKNSSVEDFINWFLENLYIWSYGAGLFLIEK